MDCMRSGHVKIIRKIWDTYNANAVPNSNDFNKSQAETEI